MNALHPGYSLLIKINSMKLKLFCSMLLILLAAQSCKKAVELKNQLVDAYWENIDGVMLQFGDQEAYVIDAGNSNLESNPAVFDINFMPYIKNIVQTGQYTYTGDIVKTVSTVEKLLPSATRIPLSIFQRKTVSW